MSSHRSASLLLAPILVFLVCETHAHQGARHDVPKSPMVKSEPTDEVTLAAIQKSYLSDVKQIFQKSCFDCHSSTPTYPWYAKLPLVRGLIQNDISEAREHLDMTNDFPFGGHATPLEDLEAIDRDVANQSMPPARYRFMHPNSSLSVDEKAKIRQWTSTSIKQMSE
ncbi:MAG: hypothetical protein EOP06_00995 [Proteobacteria bacterium]|nr:MAG: hypothetical protein EOP06_00995 [Pseudomonadota bacterium]